MMIHTNTVRGRGPAATGTGLLLLLLSFACGGADTPGSPAATGPRGENFNVVLISLDTTRADHLGCYGHQEAATPSIDRLAAEGVLFEQCIAPVPITLPSHASLMTGTDPFVHGVRYNGAFQLADDNVTLAEILGERGYSTAAELGAYVLNREFGLDQGFEVYHDLGEDRIERRAEEVADRAIDSLRTASAADRPFFLFVHFFDPHEPYEAPAPFHGRHSSRYLDEIAYMDAQVGRLLDELDSLGLREETLIVLIGDHGEGLGEHGEDGHSLFVYDSTIAVPLIVRAPGNGVPAGRRIGGQVRLIDVAPTIAEFVGAGEIPGVQGVSLLGALGDPARELDLPAYSETFFPRFAFGYSRLRSLRADGWKYVHAPSPELYRLEDDPGELANLAASDPERVRRMRGQLRNWIADSPARGGSTEAESEIDDEQWERLRSLGYVGGSAENLAAADELEVFDPAGLDPKDRVEVMALNAQAMILNRDGRLDEAEQALRRLLAIASDDGSQLSAVHDLFARVLFATGRYEESIVHYRKTLETGQASGEARTNVGAALLKLDRVDEAISELEQALQHPPVFASTHTNYGAALVAANRLEEGIRQFRLALEIDPQSLQAHRKLGSALVLAGRREEAVAVYRQAIGHHHESREARRALAELLIGLRRPNEALDQYTEILRGAPDDARANQGLGLAFLQLEQFERAVQSLRRSVELDPTSARAWYSLSAAQRMLGQTDEAIESATRALREAERTGQHGFADRIRQRIDAYREGS